MFYKIAILKNFEKFTGKQIPVLELLLTELQAWGSAIFLKSDSSIGAFLLILQIFLRISFIENTSGRLLLSSNSSNIESSDQNVLPQVIVHEDDLVFFF